MSAGFLSKIFRRDKGPKLSGDVQLIMDQYLNAKEYWKNFLKRGEESIQFYGGNQWSTEDLAAYQNSRRPVVTINMIAPLVRQVTGMRVNERLQPHVVPEREGTIERADIYTKLIYFILKKNRYQHINYNVQQDQVVTGRGYWEVDKSFENDPEGELSLRHLNWNEALPDPLSVAPYLADARYVFRAKLMSRDLIERYYGSVEGTTISEEPESLQWTDDDDLRDKNIHEDFVDSSGMYLVIEKMELVKNKKWMLTDGKNWSEHDRKQSPEELAQYGPDVQQTTKNYKQLMVTTIIPAVSGERPILKKPHKLQIGSYTIVPIDCYNAGKKLMGIVEDLKDEQRRMNKAMAQIIEILGFSSKGFWMIPRSAGIDEAQWQLNSSRPGGGVFYDGDKEPKHVNPAQMPQGYAEIFKQTLPNMQNISGITPARMGQSEYSGESGVKYAQKLQQAREQLAVIDKRFIDGFNRVCMLILKAIPQTYDREFMFQVLEGNDEVQDIKVNEKTLYGVFNDIANDTGEYDVNVEQSEETSSIRQAHNMELATMMSQVGPQFAAFFASEWIRGSDMPDKEEKAKRLEILSGQLMQMEAVKMQLAAIDAQQKGAMTQNRGRVEENTQKREDNRLAIDAQRMQLDSIKAAQEMKINDSRADMENLETAVNIKRGGVNGSPD